MISMDKEYRTRDGRKVRLLCVDGPDDIYPVIGFVEGSIGTYEWCSDGMSCESQVENIRDIIESKPRVKKTVWINFHVDGVVTVWDSEGGAREYFPQTTIARTKHEIDVEHGHGLGDANE